WANVPSPTSTDWIGLYPLSPPTPDNAYLAFAYTTGTASGSVPFPVPLGTAPGSYELRLFSNNGFTRLATSNSFTVTAAHGRAYVTNFGSNSVTVIDTTLNTFVGAPIPVGSGPLGVGVDPTVHRAYIANQNSSNVTVIDTTTNTVVGTPI